MIRPVLLALLLSVSPIQSPGGFVLGPSIPCVNDGAICGPVTSRSATYSAPCDATATVCWAFDELSGAAIDQIGTHNVAPVGAPPSIPGQVLRARSTNPTNAFHSNLTDADTFFNMLVPPFTFETILHVNNSLSVKGYLEFVNDLSTFSVYVDTSTGGGRLTYKDALNNYQSISEPCGSSEFLPWGICAMVFEPDGIGTMKISFYLDGAPVGVANAEPLMRSVPSTNQFLEFNDPGFSTQDMAFDTTVVFPYAKTPSQILSDAQLVGLHP